MPQSPWKLHFWNIAPFALDALSAKFLCSKQCKIVPHNAISSFSFLFFVIHNRATVWCFLTNQHDDTNSVPCSLVLGRAQHIPQVPLKRVSYNAEVCRIHFSMDKKATAANIRMSVRGLPPLYSLTTFFMWESMHPPNPSLSAPS